MARKAPLRIAMWSGPRNISTAMMRAWGNREDTCVTDEPLYACYLKATGLAHPMADEIIARYPTDWRAVVAELTSGELAAGKTIHYQKHMTHHLLGEMGRDWLADVTNCFLIRDPAEVIPSYVRKNDDPTLQDIGYVQQWEIFQRVRSETGEAPPVLDAKDVLTDPERLLRLLCERLGVPFSERMLSWPAGLRDTDGIWASHWYGEVATSTTFRPYRKKTEPVPGRLRDVYEHCLDYYQPLYSQRLR